MVLLSCSATGEFIYVKLANGMARQQLQLELLRLTTPWPTPLVDGLQDPDATIAEFKGDDSAVALSHLGQTVTFDSVTKPGTS